MGDLRGRLTPDGRIELALHASRSTGSSTRHWALGSHGSKRIAMDEAETIRLELPPPQPHAKWAPDLPSERAHFDALPGVLKSHNVALLLTATAMD